MGTARRLTVAPAVGEAVVLLPDGCIRFRTVGVSFIIILPMMRWDILRTIPKVTVLPIKKPWQTVFKAGGGQNPLHRDGKGCRMMTEVRNACSAIAVGSKSASAKSDDDLEKAERKAFGGCSQYSNDCKILYSGCSRHPDY